MPLPSRPVEGERAPVDRLPLDRLNGDPKNEVSARRGSLSQRKPIRGDDGREVQVVRDSPRDARPNGSRSEVRDPDGEPLTVGSRRPTLPIRKSSTSQPLVRDARTNPESPFGNDDEDGFTGKRRTYDEPGDYTAATLAGEAVRTRQPSKTEADVKGKGKADSVHESTSVRSATRPTLADSRDRVLGKMEALVHNGRAMRNDGFRDSTITGGRNEGRGSFRELDDGLPAPDRPSRDFRDQQDRAGTRNDIRRTTTNDNANPYDVPARTDSLERRQQDDKDSRTRRNPRDRLATTTKDDCDRCGSSCSCGKCNRRPRSPAPNTSDSRSYVPSQATPRSGKRYHSDRNSAVEAPRISDSRSYGPSQAPRSEKQYHNDRDTAVHGPRFGDESRRGRDARDVAPTRKREPREPDPDTHGSKRATDRDRYAQQAEPREPPEDTYGSYRPR